MARKINGSKKPTGAELELLQVLWMRGPSTVREIHESLGHKRETGYTTTLKILQKMAAKGLVRRDESQRTHIYRAVGRAEETQKHLVSEMLDKVFGGRPGQLVVQALSEKRATPEELAEIRKVLDQLEQQTNPNPKGH